MEKLLLVESACGKCGAYNLLSVKTCGKCGTLLVGLALDLENKRLAYRAPDGEFYGSESEYLISIKKGFVLA